MNIRRYSFHIVLKLIEEEIDKLYIHIMASINSIIEPSRSHETPIFSYKNILLQTLLWDAQTGIFISYLYRLI